MSVTQFYDMPEHVGTIGELMDLFRSPGFTCTSQQVETLIEKGKFDFAYVILEKFDISISQSLKDKIEANADSNPGAAKIQLMLEKGNLSFN